MSIIVFSENRSEKIKKSSLEAVAYATNISKNTQQAVVQFLLVMCQTKNLKI